MKLEELIKIAKKQPIIQPQMLLKGDEPPAVLRVQLSRWVKAGKLIQLKRGYFVLNPQYTTLQVSEKFLATYIYPPSYISLEFALAHYGLIPEAVYMLTLITTRRPSKISNPLFSAIYRHIKKDLFWGYGPEDVAGQTYFVATPEKALLDFFYFCNFPITDSYIEELRLQNLDELDEKKFLVDAAKFKSKKIDACAKKIQKLIKEEREGYKRL